jgi:hypothetical protein
MSVCGPARVDWLAADWRAMASATHKIASDKSAAIHFLDFEVNQSTR